MKLKNKMRMALERLIEEAKKAGASPDCIELSPTEAHELLIEISKFRWGTKSNVTPTGQHVEVFEFNLQEFSSAAYEFHQLPAGRQEAIIHRWKCDDYEIRYRHVPLKIVNPVTGEGK